MIGKGASARSIRLELPEFTLVGATTRAGMLTAPLRDRFGVDKTIHDPGFLFLLLPLQYKSLTSLLLFADRYSLLKAVAEEYWSAEKILWNIPKKRAKASEFKRKLCRRW